MNLLITTFFLISLWLSSASSIFKYFGGIFKNNLIIKSHIYFSISLGFFFSFSVLAAFNILLHLFGITFSNSYLLIIITGFLIRFNFKRIEQFCIDISSNLKISLKNIFRNLDPFIKILILIIFSQALCLFVRFLLPVTHGDALNQYFYDSIQISRLENLSISDYYQIGEYFRTDSFASFFDAIILQLTDNWFLVRTVRVLALILVILNSLEMTLNIGNINFKRGVLLVAIILTLPDVWSIFLSGKQDGYAFLFEIIGIYSIILSILSKEIISKITLSTCSIFIGLISICIRMSSLTFLLIGIIIFIYNAYSFPIRFYIKGIWNFFQTIKAPLKLLLASVLTLSLIICFFNLKYFSNPIYWVSPPGFLNYIFPNAIYKLDYTLTKDNLSLNNVPFLIKPITTIFYSTFGIEPLRYGLNKLRDSNNLILLISNFLNYIGPKSLMVSIHSFSPFMLLPYLSLKNLINQKQRTIIITLTLWILLWSISIPYTRVALASSTAIVVFGLSQSYNFKFEFRKNKLLDFVKFSIFSCGIIFTILFSLWSLSNLNDLPLKALIDNKAYSRTYLTSEYLKKNNNNLLPNPSFQSNWEKIEQENKENLLLIKGIPKRYAYFMKRGLITSRNQNIPNKIKNQTYCFKIDSSNQIIKYSCE